MNKGSVKDYGTNPKFARMYRDCIASAIHLTGGKFEAKCSSTLLHVAYALGSNYTVQVMVKYLTSSNEVIPLLCDISFEEEIRIHVQSLRNDVPYTIPSNIPSECILSNLAEVKDYILRILSGRIVFSGILDPDEQLGILRALGLNISTLRSHIGIGG